jgi:uncharacterized protein with HEPN domain
LADKKSYHAVIYNIMIMGEAANMLTFEFRESHPEIEWKQIANCLGPASLRALSNY